MIPLRDVERAYIAGIVDGEGTVTLMKHHANETPTPNVAVYNNSLKLLLWLKSRLRGVIVSRKKRLPHHNNSYVWSIRQDRAIRLLRDIKQHLIIKKPQAELIVKYYKSVTHRNGRYTPKMLQKKMQLVAKIRKLNQR